MSGQIRTPDLSDPTTASVQMPWQYSVDACYRPSPDFHLPILCTAYGPFYTSGSRPVNNSTYAEDESEFYENYAACCPADKHSNNRTTIWTLTAICGGPVCFTLDETIARNFDDCVDKQVAIAEKKAKEDGTLPANATRSSNASSWCEYVDYKMPKAGVKSQSST